MNGVICIYKEKGYTSFDVVAIMRRFCGTRKIGHGGTLDPMAEGVLPIFVGTATKAVDYCPDNTKEYRAGLRFGVTTDTQDFTGKVLSTCDTKVPPEAQESLKAKFTGDLMQTPPMYSAVQVDGQRLYELARKGIEVDREPRAIKIFSIGFEDFENNTATMTVSCSKGTYIRTLIHDMGVELGTGAIMTSLVRTRSGNFTLRDCYKLSEVREASERGGKDAVEKLLMPIDIIFNALPAARLNEVQTRMFLNGVVLDINRVSLDRPEGPFRILSAGGRVIGIGTTGENSDLAVMQRFFGAPEKKGDDSDDDDTERAGVPDSHLKDISELKGVKL
ncbi:MAG: tRNA pseudouridine(55) synthase TruB [Ruminiclostridium sp.]|nr:tRNA pseudouridine(55) synthase TruB [Ruminiclostridium sp.]